MDSNISGGDAERSMVGKVVKRGIDVAISSIALLVLAPLMCVVGVCIACTIGRPILFRQVRPGLQGRPFTIVKFRTMRALRPGEDPYRSDAVRLTRLGTLLRKFSIDELPQLWNVLTGDMSLVGPRPLLMEYLGHYDAEQNRRHDVRPGITGWAQVNGRQGLLLGDRLALDVWYVDHWSLRLDFKILAMTVLQALHGSGVDSGQDFDEFDDLSFMPKPKDLP